MEDDDEFWDAMMYDDVDFDCDDGMEPVGSCDNCGQNIYQDECDGSGAMWLVSVVR